MTQTAATRKMEEFARIEGVQTRIRAKYPNFTFPDPVLEPLFVGRMMKSPLEGRFAVMDSNTDEVFGLCTDQYKIVYHEEVLDSIGESLTGLKSFGEPKVQIKMFGGKMAVDLIWDGKKNKKEVKKGDYVAPRIRMKNSYDLGWKLEYTFGAMQLVCTNGMTALKTMSRMSKRHITSLRADVFANEVGEGLHNFGEQVALWEAWAGTKITLPQAIEVVQSLPFSESEMKKVMELDIIGGNNLSLTKMGEQKVPVTLWDVHSAATQFLTHEIKSDLRKIEDEIPIERAFSNFYQNLTH